MNTTTQVGGGKGNVIAFLFGAIFNLFGSVNMTQIVDSAVQAVVGGIIVLLFKILGDYFDPQLKKFVAWLRGAGKPGANSGNSTNGNERK